MAPNTKRFVGIDLGTTFSSLSYVNEQGRPVSVDNADGRPLTPSAVWIRGEEDIVVGAQALEATQSRPHQVATGFKRDMGEEFYRREIEGKQYSPEVLSSLVLKKLVEDAQPQIGDCAGAVITVPAYFGDLQRKATEDAGRIASIDVIGMINEPTAAALANAFRQFVEGGGDTTHFEMAEIAATAPSTTLLFDLGGGTFDVTIIRIDGSRFDVIATGGEVRLGGIDFDQRILDFLSDEFARRHGVDPRDNEEVAARLRKACEMAKIALSTKQKAAISCHYLGRRLELPISRQKFEDLTADLVTRCQISTEMLLEDALLTWSKIDDVLMVGGSSQMPAIQNMIAKISGHVPNMAIAPTEIVAHGAAIHATILQMRQVGASPFPAQGAERRFDTDFVLQPADAPDLPDLGTNDPDQQSGPIPIAGADDDEKVNLLEPLKHDPNDSQYALMALFDDSVRNAAMSVNMTDVNSHSLGIIVRSSKEQRIANSCIIPRNTPLPASRKKVFGTEADDQQIIRVPITEGESRDPRGCRTIGECVIQDLPSGLPKGSPVEVSFEYDTNGRVRVQAVEKSYGRSAVVEIERESGFSQENLDQLAQSIKDLELKNE